jgi:acyl carrier protein
MVIKETIKKFILQELVQEGGAGDIQESDPLIENGIIDSFGIMALLGFLEEKFAVQIESDELMPENFESIETIAELVIRKSPMQMWA